ncbi:MAG TPA: hypothetical protein VGF33_09980 [Caulobacteraceae bacterium]|jgi:hypothetical protein
MSDGADPIPYSPADLERLVRLKDARAIDQAYQMTFGSSLGRLVLLNFLTDCQVGARTGRGAHGYDLQYLAGQQDAALALAARAGFGPETVALSTLTKTLEERREPNDDDRPTGVFEDDLPGGE